MFRMKIHFAFYFFSILTEKNLPKNSKKFKNITAVNKTSLSAYLPVSYTILIRNLVLIPHDIIIFSANG